MSLEKRGKNGEKCTRPMKYTDWTSTELIKVNLHTACDAPLKGDELQASAGPPLAASRLPPVKLIRLLTLTQLFFTWTNSLLPTNRELPDSPEKVHLGGGRSQLPAQPASAGLLHLPLSGLPLSPRRCGSRGPGPRLLRVAKEKHQGAGCLLKMQNQCRHALFQDKQKLSHHEWGETLDDTEAAKALEKSLNRAARDLRALRSARADSV
ncbi:hypothetical protein J1605_021121 [Eschrichtius robustus]|uniref:Uncharacterized protein n=1 Tax=Eschrichtius robustus TaxID=9764 RepID=A0AB34HDV3_ESCRO|nr:hypothetical protein J1605_021121 [Eschrichtius robustus]